MSARDEWVLVVLQQNALHTGADCVGDTVRVGRLHSEQHDLSRTSVADRRSALLDEGLGDIACGGRIGVVHGVRRLLDLELVAHVGSRRWIEVAELTRIHHQALVVRCAGDRLECRWEDRGGWLLRPLGTATV